MEIGSVVTRVRWLNTPDKYGGPALFDTPANARAHAPSGVITARLSLATPDGRLVELDGGVSTADPIWRTPTRQDPGVLPVVGARLVAVDDRDHVFTNPDGGDWVLIG
ncbi:hypothetical protein DFJ66_8330 [Saccharothrix variisporea]|uniref:Uncharacterized protein n=1 Tax=Saccharothrix variisporea TaxID=543527 RepID=A0A495XP25_9PSEU|nr:hypothetical protein DFJ66_8330 [Saccharothrix variisporea]